MKHFKKNTLSFYLFFIFLLCLNYTGFAFDYQLNPVQSIRFSDTSIQSCQVIDFNNDQYDDIAVKNGNQINIYSPFLDSILWSISLENSEDTWLVNDFDLDSSLEIVTFDNYDTLRVYNFNGSIVKNTLGLMREIALSGSTEYTDFAIENIDSDPQPEIIVSIVTFCCYDICGATTGYEQYSRSMFAVDGLNFTKEQIFPVFPYFSGGTSFDFGDFNGDGEIETISDGYVTSAYCEQNPYWHVINNTYYNLNIFNNAGQKLYSKISTSNYVTMGLDVNLNIPGEELVIISRDLLFGDSSTTENEFLYIAKIVDEKITILNKINKTEYNDRILELPTMSGYFGIKLKITTAWHVINGENGSVDSRIFGLTQKGSFYNGRFTTTSEQVLQIMQSLGDSITLFSSDQLTDISYNDTINLPHNYQVFQNYPNPFNPSTTISFNLPEKSHVSIDIINLKGQKVYKITDQSFSAGSHEVIWNADGFSSGIYIYRITTENFTYSKKMLLLK